jgi:hypothetical protein
MGTFSLNIEAEIWKPVVGAENRYEVSSLGNVRAVGRMRGGNKGCTYWRAGVALKPYTSAAGYVNVSINAVPRGIHVLVCEAFHGPRPDGCHAAHSDGVKSNNRLENLRWATVSENAMDKLAHGTLRCGEASNLSKLRADDVLEIRSRASHGETGSALAKAFGLTKQGIHAIIARKNWKYI